MPKPILRVAVPSPLRRLFDYLSPDHGGGIRPQPGMRVQVPFQRRTAVGVIVEVADRSEVPPGRLRAARDLLDEAPLFPTDDLALLAWAWAYYHHPPGEVCAAALPAVLRQGGPARTAEVLHYRLTPCGRDADPSQLCRAPRQAQLLKRLGEHEDGLSAGNLGDLSWDWRPAMKRLSEKGWVAIRREPLSSAAVGTAAVAGPPLNAAQQQAVGQVRDALGTYEAFLLDGVTGSGKTEVYLKVIEAVLAAGRQALVLVPEIGLTPQLLDRFRRRFPVPVAVLHSGLADGERLNAWVMARDGTAPIVVGTRSAVFTPCKALGVIIVDEEHDPSYKQQDGFRYSARDVAVMRARRSGLPVLLGSATPSLESLFNVGQGRYRPLVLPERAGAAVHPRMHLVDLRGRPLTDGLGDVLLGAMGRHLEQGGQVLLFLNRRGYAPTLLCHDCGWVSRCHRCDAHMTVYTRRRRQCCHHCGGEQPIPSRCPDCGSSDLRPLGQGTERVEEALRRRFPEVGIARIDRDSTRTKNALTDILAQIRDGRTRILIGTQMLAKGHHFPGVTLVGVLDSDQGLFSTDFRAGERMAQLIIQVAGRAGRADRPGEVLIQTHHPEHPLLQHLVGQDYRGFAEAAMAERREAALPPFSHLALLRAEAVPSNAPLAFLEEAARLARALAHAETEILGPVPAPMERRAGRFRAQLLLQAPGRASLHQLLERWLPELERLKAGRRVRWSLDVDPAEMF